jgi:hypothetical protein
MGKPLEKFVCKKCGSKEYYSCAGGKVLKCKPCQKSTRKAKYYKDPQRSKDNVMAWRKANPERSREIQRKYWERNPERYAELLSGRKRERSELRVRVLRHHAGGDPSCACCGERETRFLVVDHTEGGGNKHRKEIGRVGTHFYKWLLENEFPPGFRVLCHNCNFSIGAYGDCPHRTFVRGDGDISVTPP